MYKIGDKVKIKDYSEWDNIEPFKRLVQRYTQRAPNGVMIVTGLDARGYTRISSSIEDSLEIGSIILHESSLESVDVCVTCNQLVYCGKHDHFVDMDDAHSVGEMGNGKVECGGEQPIRCVTCDCDISTDYVTHPVTYLGQDANICESCNDKRIER